MDGNDCFHVSDVSNFNKEIKVIEIYYEVYILGEQLQSIRV